MRSLTQMVVVVLSLGASLSARATTFEDTTVEALAAASDVIVRGQVVAADALPHGPGGLPGIHTRVVLRAEETLAGAAASTVVIWVHGGRVGDSLRIVHGQARFAVGEEVVVFLFRSPSGELWPTGMARGKWLVASAGMDDPLVRATAPPDGDDDQHTGAPYSPGALAYPMSELRALVHAARSGR